MKSLDMMSIITKIICRSMPKLFVGFFFPEFQSPKKTEYRGKGNHTGAFRNSIGENGIIYGE